VGLKLHSKTKVKKLPRMADVAEWVTACETAFWPAGTFMSAYRDNHAAAMEDAAEADALVVAMRVLMEKRETWSGTATVLLRDLSKIAAELQLKPRQLYPNTIKAALVRAAPILRHAGIKFESNREKSRGRERVICISRAAEPSALSAMAGRTAMNDRH
jgi:hypothetical protein